MNFNFIVLTDLLNNVFNFKKLLSSKDTIIWKNCKNIKITVFSKINKFEFDNCYNIKLTLDGTVSGLEINNSNLTLNLYSNHSISSLQLYKSDLIVKGSKNDFKKIHLINEESTIKFINQN
jgi:hypothetical protein